MHVILLICLVLGAAYGAFGAPWIKRLRDVAKTVQREPPEWEPWTAESYINHAAAYRRRLQQRLAALRTELGL